MNLKTCNTSITFRRVPGIKSWLFFPHHLWDKNCITEAEKQTYWLVRRRMTLQSLGKIVSFIRLRKTQKIFNRNSCRRARFFQSKCAINRWQHKLSLISVQNWNWGLSKGVIRRLDSPTFSSSLLWKLLRRWWKWISVICLRRERRQETYSPCRKKEQVWKHINKSAQHND